MNALMLWHLGVWMGIGFVWGIREAPRAFFDFLGLFISSLPSISLHVLGTFNFLGFDY
jgi:hypothetical protein